MSFGHLGMSSTKSLPDCGMPIATLAIKLRLTLKLSRQLG
jgi:hypothetical protein